ncbi:hypothetical protein [Telluria aromaticivorans]|uniref:Uncharacterized protein n=1 Tax=Telluria aromaticivorans TaxID=2725995 RepID=A0A7Y2P112_9BURK|nr:hypothetical protein [Telluria aromaticivorans]NNG25482.1 hypothetical protein [Telluria aromaticivorans]
MGDIGRASARPESTGVQLQDASSQLAALGKKTRGIGKQLEAENRAVGKTVRDLFNEAVSRGLVKPVPGSESS